MKILVTYGWCRTAYGVVRSLATAGHEVIVASSHRLSMAGASRSTRRYYITPDPYEAPSAYAKRIAEIARSETIDVIFPVHEDNLVLRQHDDLLPSGCVLAAPSRSCLERTLDKGRFARLLAELELAHPRTWIPNSPVEAHALFEREDVCYPLVLKTRRGNGGKGTVLVSNAHEARACYNELITRYGLEASPPLLQKFVAGSLVGLCFLAHHGQVVATFGERYLRQKEQGFGTSVLREPFELPAASALLAPLVKALDYDGLGQLDLLVDEYGQLKILELNPRIWGGLELALENGFDFPAASLDQLMGASTEARFTVRPPRASAWLLGEGIALVEELRRGAPLKDTFAASHASIRQAASFDDFKPDDPLPFVVEALDYGLGFLASRGSANPSSSGMFGGSKSTRHSSFYARFGKRVLDVGLATAAFAAFALPMVGIGALIHADAGAPALFHQTRVGRFGEHFTVHKFRTMVPRAAEQGTVSVAGDARVTRVGQLLRRFKLDELPQLWNILIGEMSFVGPRPDVPGFADKLEGGNRRVLDLRPGLTGPASLAFAREEELLATVEDPERYNREVIYPEKVRLNLEYLEHLSLSTDIRYIARTLGLWKSTH